MLTKHPWMLMVALVMSLLMVACGGADAEQTATDRLTAVATTGMVADVVRAVGGDHVEVVQLMGPGVDPHLYKATEGDVNKLTNADMIFYSGHHLEARLTDVFEQIGRTKPAVAVAEAIPEEELITDPNFATAIDPHVWMDPLLWARTVPAVRDALSDFDPDNADDYRANAETYSASVADLSTYVAAQVERVPIEDRLLITAHDAFAYFGKGFDYEVFAPQGISTAAEAGVDDIRRTIDMAVDRQIPAIFVESSVPPDIVNAIVEGARNRGHQLEIGGELFSDAMGEPGTETGTYIGMIRHNIDTIVAPTLK